MSAPAPSEAGRRVTVDYVRTAIDRSGQPAIGLARAIGVDKNVIYGFLHHKHWPQRATLAKIERHYGWDPGTLMRLAWSVDSPAPAAPSTPDVAPAPASSAAPSSKAGRQALADVLSLTPDAIPLRGLSHAELMECRSVASAAFLERARAIRAERRG